MTFARRALKKNKGIAVILALFFMILLSLIAVALIGLVPVELRSATRNKLDLQAHYAATSGIRHAKAWCSAVMTPASDTSPDSLGDPVPSTHPAYGTSGNGYYPSGGSYNNEITGVNGTHPLMEYTVMQLMDLWNSGYVPHNTARWSDVNEMLNIPSSGPNSVDDHTVIVVKKAPLVLGDWSVYTVIIPDAESPGGVNSLDPGKTQITRSFGGTGSSGQRAYQIIALAYYQGFPTIRAKSTVLEDSFARYSLFVDRDPTNTWALQASAGEVTTFGPVHTNSFFRFALNSNLWSDASGVTPFNGLMTYAQEATEADGVDASFVGKDGNRYYGGNDVIGTNQDNRPFDDAGAEVGTRYTKLMGGKGNLRKAANVALPPDSMKISNAAYGTDYQTGTYSGSSVATHYKTGSGEPDGIFVFPNSDGKAAGGVVVKNDQKSMFLEVVDTDGKPILNTSSLEAGTASGNPAIRVQAKTAATSIASTVTSTVWTTGTITVTTSYTSGSTSGLTSSRIRVTTGSTTGVSTERNTLYSTSWSTGSSLSYSTLYGTSTIRNTVTNRTTSSSSRLIYSYSTSYTTIGGAGGVVQPVVHTSTSTSWSSWTVTNSSVQTTLSSSATSTRTSTVTFSSSSRIATSTQTTLHTTTSYQTTRSWSTWTTTGPNWVTESSTTLSSTYSISTSVAGATWNPIDQVIEARNVGVNLVSTMFARNISASANYSSPAGGIGSAANMDVSSLAGMTLKTVQGDGSLADLGATTVSPGHIVVIKQSRTDPTVAIVTIIDATADDEGKLLNGAVLTEGNIGDGANKGLAGVNMGRKTIGGQIQDSVSTQTDDPTSFAQRPTKPSTYLGIANNLFQYGTSLNETNQSVLRADNGLGLVAEDVRVNADPTSFTSWDGVAAINYSTQMMLNIHAVILAGSQTNGGLTIKGFTSLDDLTPGNLGTAVGHTPLIRFMGGLILHNYYPRVNGVTGAGWNSKNIYNQQLALVPPPYFPNNGLLIPLSYVEERIWADQDM